MLFLQGAIVKESLFPIGLGSKAASAVHKSRGCLHAVLLQYGWQMLNITRSETFTVTSDLGTEASIAEFQTERWYVLPLWQRQALQVAKRTKPQSCLRTIHKSWRKLEKHRDDFPIHDLWRNHYIKNVVLFEENSTLQLPVVLVYWMN